MGSFTEAQEMALVIFICVLSFVSLVSASYIAITVIKNKPLLSRMYHRLMLATAINVMILSARAFFAFFAIPEGTLNASLARGTTGTCSAAGFVYQIFFFAVPSYYCALSVYSYVAMRNKFHVEKYAWIEKWIHIAVYTFPLISACYLLSIDSFNYNGGGCWIASVPLGCGKDGIECTRGPQNIAQIQLIFGAAPLIILMVIPTIVMIMLYCSVRRTNNHNKSEAVAIDAMTVAKQASVYVLTLYWTYFFGFVNVTAIFRFGIRSFALQMLAQNERLLGLWIMLVYRYFRRVRSVTATDSSLTDDDHPTRDVIHQEFSIFDGSCDPSSPWAKYIFDGDEEEDEEDRLESDRWGAIQDHT